MTVRITKPEFNIREKLSELDIPVGNHGTQLMKSSDVAETHNLLQLKNRRKNYFINGDCRIWQRGTSNPNVNHYTCDRWWRANGVSQVDRSTDVPAYGTTGAEAFTYSMKVTSNGTGSSIGQPIELTDTGVSQFGNGKQYTLSFYAKTDSGTGDVTAVMYYRNSKFSSTNQINWEPSHAPHLGTMNRGWQRFVYTFTAPAVHSNNTVLAFELSFNVTTYFTGFQLEEGPQVTPFEFTNKAEELVLCQRYFAVFPGRSGGVPFWQGYMGASYGYCSVFIPINMRAVPSPTDATNGNSTTSGNLYDAGGTNINGNFAGNGTVTLSCAGYAPSGLSIIMNFGNHQTGDKDGVVASWNGASPGIFLDAEL